MQLANAACYTLNVFLLARYEANLVTSHAVLCSESEKQFILLLLLESILEEAFERRLLSNALGNNLAAYNKSYR